ncbi:glycosyl hydrolase family 16 [Colletotrichum scovillei]|uniref:Glycosyl hydrolase family 16 n=3 Tax=Colletotrichum acutatum species complex TaxID=2707335 RepID=A0A9P7RGB8_9PEZI|nr:glycosyl hydrolase family 16 [Colletotrichum scovillei]KAF4786050.1 glycosyl hydrolase family 16 [Colletotrichum scovillei]KAG7055546.1 glycosyl hydrolase family 16 [Colletotrichum scovillei]KAG7074979.1 glycosyl hydrolase family 16 [Colletotrichum scovillei]KAG7082194.1 glycosyl hydrolase family 16 [Colletotrichum scovillei]
MKMLSKYAQLLFSLTPFVGALVPPAQDGMRIIWSETFQGNAGAPPRSDTWNVALAIDTNNEVQTYTESSWNVQISGGETIQLIPRKSASGVWTSARIETKAAWTPQPGGKMRVQSMFRMGDNANKQGMWPAFWMLGDAVRNGVQWPLCGELDIFEQINGQATATGTVHCQQESGGICNEPSGRGVATSMPDNGWHTWALEWDRTSNNWVTETITWYRDGVVFNQLKGSDIGDEGIWATLCHMPYYVLMNVAVGGTLPGSPTDATQDGYGSMMEIGYLTVYQSP